MGRKSNFVRLTAIFSIFAAFCSLAQAQPQRSHGQRPNGRMAAPPRHLPPARGTQERWLSLPPADRQIFRRNAERWMQMSPEQRNILRDRENLRREKIKRETEEALRNSGLLLDQQKRDLFESRYMQERRRMEQTLRQQIESERQQQLPALIQQLKKEFQSQQSGGSVTPKPTEPPKSGN